MQSKWRQGAAAALLLAAVSAVPAGSAPIKQKATLLGHDVQWSVGAKALELTYSGEPDQTWLRTQHGEAVRAPRRPVERADGKPWQPLDLQNQIQKDMQGEMQLSASDKTVPQRVKLSATGYGWDTLAALPYAVRFAARRDLVRFTRKHLKLVAKRNPDFRRVHDEDEVEAALGLSTAGQQAVAEKLLGAPAPEPFHLLYFARGEAPDWTTPGLVVVHATRAQHFPARAEEPTARLLAAFHRRQAPVALLVDNDRLNDATDYARPQAGDLALFSEDGRHVLGAHCPEITFAGGHLDGALGLAVRSYIANAFAGRSSGRIVAHLACDAIYTANPTGLGTECAETAFAEIHRVGVASFVKRHIDGEYVEPEHGLRLLRQLDPMRGRTYPFLEDDRFRVEVQENGVALGPVRGDASSSRVVVIDLVGTRAAAR